MFFFQKFQHWCVCSISHYTRVRDISHFILQWFESIFLPIIQNSGLCLRCETVLIWISQRLTDEKSTLVHVMTWCCQATSNHLSQTYIPDHYDSLWHGLLCRLEFNSRSLRTSDTCIFKKIESTLARHWTSPSCYSSKCSHILAYMPQNAVGYNISPNWCLCI